MIQKISIQDYRSCLDTTIELHPNLSVLIGPNSSGKTNILNAFLLLRKLLEEDEYHRFQEQEPTGQCILKVWFNVDKKTVIFTAKVDVFTDENNRDVIVSSHQRWYAKDFTGNKRLIQAPLWELNRRARQRGAFRITYRQKYLLSRKPEILIPVSAADALEKIAENISEIRYYGASQFTNPANCPVSFEIEKEGPRRRPLPIRRFYEHAKFLYDLYSIARAPNDKCYMEFFEIVGPKGIGLIDKIEFQDILVSSVDYTVRSGGRITKRKREKVLVIPQFHINKNVLSPSQLSEGTFKTITLLFYLITEPSNILLIEEPEVCVHHGLLSSIIELIKNYSIDKQIIITTHSDFVLDKVEPENVYRVTNIPQSGTKVNHIPKAMSRREFSALRDYLDTEGNLGEYWRHGGLEE